MKDLKPDELIGRTVLINSRYSNRLGKIEKVNKTTFSVKGEGQPFKLSNGRQNGSDSWSSTYAEVITDEKANELRTEWKEKVDIAASIIRIEASLKTLPLSILNQIIELLPKA